MKGNFFKVSFNGFEKSFLKIKIWIRNWNRLFREASEMQDLSVLSHVLSDYIIRMPREQDAVDAKWDLV